MVEATEIRIDEHGDETHESWLLIGANHVQSSPSQWLFDSEIAHQHYIVVTVTRCSRKRELSHDWLDDTKVLLKVAMSQAQWGAFVSSFGRRGVPATLQYLGGIGSVPEAPAQSRFDESHAEVRQSGEKALGDISRGYDAVMEAFETGGKKALRETLRDLRYAIQNAPANMEFAAKSLTEHVENVVTKARADIEGMALSAAEHGVLTEPVTAFELESGAIQEADQIEERRS